MIKEFDDTCNKEIKETFTSLNVYFIIMLITLTVCVGLTYISLVSYSSGMLQIRDTFISPYFGIAVLVLCIVTIVALNALRSLRRQVCGNDGTRYSILG